MKIFKATIEEMARDMIWIIKWILKECSMYLLIWLVDWTSYNITEHTTDHLEKKATAAFTPD